MPPRTNRCPPPVTTWNQRPPVADLAATFGVDDARLRSYRRRASLNLCTDDTAFLDPTDPDRYVVVSVDPAGGGELSDEAFVVFLVAGSRIGLLTGRSVPGHNARYGFSMIPLVFVVALLVFPRIGVVRSDGADAWERLHTVRNVQHLLREAHGRCRHEAAPFRMPPVIVLIENNFAYGAATIQASVGR